MGESTVLCSVCTVHDVIVKQFTFAISSPDELLVISPMLYAIAMGQITIKIGYDWPKL